MQNKPETDKQQGKYIWKFASAGKDNEISAMIRRLICQIHF